MFESIPVPIQALLWPLAGAVLVLTAGRVVPGWLRRLVAAAAAAATLLVLWPPVLGASLQAHPAFERVEILWNPLNLFRVSPTLDAGSLSLLAGITLAWIMAAIILGLRGAEGQRASWYAFALVGLVGGLVVVMGGNLLTLALGSALIDMAFIAMTATAVGSSDRVFWRIAVQGFSSTLLLLVAALWMDTQAGTTSLSAKIVAKDTPMLLGLAGGLRLLTFPIHPRRMSKPEHATAALLSGGVGLYLLARAQTMAFAVLDGVAQALPGQSWFLLASGASLLAGGLMVWSHGLWPGVFVHQMGQALAFVLLVDLPLPWPIMSGAFALGILAICWDGEQAAKSSGSQGWHVRILARLRVRWKQGVSYARARLPALNWRLGHAGLSDSSDAGLGRMRGRRLVRLALPFFGLASVAGLPLTAGSIMRWHLYAALLARQRASLLIAIQAADLFLTAGLWSALVVHWRRSSQCRPSLSATVAMAALAIPCFILGIAPQFMGLQPIEVPDVARWALGLLVVMPWLAGAWLAQAHTRLGGRRLPLGWVHRVVTLSWFYESASWVGQRLVAVIHWLGQVGEGEGWWGWALAVLALGAWFLARN